MVKGDRSRESLMNELESLKATISDLKESISQRNKADKESQNNLNIFHLLNSLAPAGIYLTDTKGDCIYANASWLKMAGLKMEDALGVGWLKGIHPDDLEMVKSTWYHSQETRTNWKLEYRFISSEGAVTWVRGMAAPYYDSTNEKLGYVGINMDITERINVEEELRKSEALAKRERDLSEQYLDIAEVILVSLDKNGNVQLINPKGCKVLGYKKEEISGKNWFDNFLPAKLRESVKEVSRMVYSGEMETVKYFENEIITKLGDERTIAWNNSVLKDADGSIIGTLSSGEDITERKRAEAELKKHQEHLLELVDERTKGLEKKNQELDRMLKVFVGRELKIKELQTELSNIRQHKSNLD